MSAVKDLVDQCLNYLNETENRCKLEENVLDPVYDHLMYLLYDKIFPFL